MKENHILNLETGSALQTGNDGLKEYHKPRLKELGDLRSLTLGTSLNGFADSGCALYSESGSYICQTPTP